MVAQPCTGETRPYMSPKYQCCENLNTDDWLSFFSEANPNISSIENLPLPLFIVLEKDFRIKLVQKCCIGTFNLVLLR